MSEISVIVPVYNVEKYLPRCLDSILAQTLTDFELILVDDGSPDNCGIICDEYAKKDNRIRVIHKENGGVSSSRNAGLKVVTGKYLTFCDSDDYVDIGWLEAMINEIQKHDYDSIATNFRERMGTQIIRTKTYPDSIWTFNTGKERIDYIINQVLNFQTGWSLCNRLFKKNIIRENNIVFCENCENYAEDLAFVLEYILHSHSACNIDDCSYNYCRHEDSKMGQVTNNMNLNALNEVSKWLFRLVKSLDDEYLKEFFPILSYKMFFSCEYAKFYKNFCYRDYPNEIKKISDKRYFRKMNRRTMFSYKKLRNYYSRNEALFICYFSWYGIHRCYRLFALCDIIAHKFLYQ